MDREAAYTLGESDCSRSSARGYWVRRRLPTCGWLLSTRAGPNNLRRSWYPLRAAVTGARATRFHDLRHSCVTLLLDLGVPPHIVRDIVGHSDIEVTMTIYAHVSLEESERRSGSSMTG